MGKRTELDRNSIRDLMGVVSEEEHKLTEAERKQALKDSVKIGCVPDDYMYISVKRETKFP